MKLHKGFIIGGTHSGCGKTTITMGLVRALKNRGVTVQPWKSGPDYIDPGFHSAASGRICRNLDTMILSDDAVKEIYSRQDGDISVIEGVMGLFDGAGGLDERGSAAHIAKLLGLPVILVIDAKAMARSAGAIALGFAEFDKDVTIAGFIMNRVGSDRHYTMLKESIEERTGLPVLGRLPRDPSIEIPERHLGLNTDWESEELDSTLETLSALVEKHINVDLILKIAEKALPLTGGVPELFSEDSRREPFVKIAVARDRAFHFYYEDNLDLLRHYGAQIVFFSPLEDKELPMDVSALYLGGGYPEVFARELSSNSSMIMSIRALCEKGLPLYGECGGFMYLTEGIIDKEDTFHALLNLLPGKTRLGKKLRSLGYCRTRLNHDSILGEKDSEAMGHVFHWAELETLEEIHEKAFTVMKGDQVLTEGFIYKNVLGSWVHHHFASNPQMALHFVEAAIAYRNNQ
jgi:cobyrinic acid a,c-diamide synthase